MGAEPGTTTNAQAELCLASECGIRRVSLCAALAAACASEPQSATFCPIEPIACPGPQEALSHQNPAPPPLVLEALRRSPYRPR